MPIITPNSDAGLYGRLFEAGATVVTEDEAMHQDIRPARIGILNLMPKDTMESTETQWLRYMSQTVLQVEPRLIKFDDDPREREGSRRKTILTRYTPFSEVAEEGLDGLIVTGANLELRPNSDITKPEQLPFDEIIYAKQLAEIIGWARDSVYSTVYSCLASHFALNALYGIEREIKPQKVLGVFEHEVLTDTKSEFVAGLDDVLAAPHSRWGNVAPEALQAAGVGVLAVNKSIGWLLAEDANQCGGTDLFVQGHPEYDKYDLHTEYARDRQAGQAAPFGYYDEANKPRLTWANGARALHSNWIASIYRHFSNSLEN